MTYAHALVLGLVQGLTEFLPVSSSGHLILVPHVFGWTDQGLAFDAMVHWGTLGALVAYFRRELVDMLTGELSLRLAIILVVATFPAGIVGLVFGPGIERNFRWPLVVATSTAAWAIVMWVADRRACPAPAAAAEDPLGRVTLRQGVVIGFAQAVALIPGTSRSGITISAGLLEGLDRATAARFSFLLGIPITAAAATLKTIHFLRSGVPAGDSGPLGAALAAAFVSGWVAVWFLVQYLKRRSLLPFVVYRLVLAAIIVFVTLRK